MISQAANAFFHYFDQAGSYYETEPFKKALKGLLGAYIGWLARRNDVAHGCVTENQMQDFESEDQVLEHFICFAPRIVAVENGQSIGSRFTNIVPMKLRNSVPNLRNWTSASWIMQSVSLSVGKKKIRKNYRGTPGEDHGSRSLAALKSAIAASRAQAITNSRLRGAPVPRRAGRSDRSPPGSVLCPTIISTYPGALDLVPRAPIR